MRTIYLDPRAETDIEDLTRYTIDHFGLEQAAIYYDELFKQFDLIAEHPKLGHPVKYDHSSLYSFLFGSHVIIYFFDDRTLTIRRVIHGRMDLLRHL